MVDFLRKRPHILICSLLVVGAFAVFGPTLRYGFIGYDDHLYVTGNQHVKAGLTIPSVKWALTAGYVSTWQPVVWLSYMLDRQLFGPGPFGFHLTNVLLHILNTLLLFLLLSRLTGRAYRSAFVAALFAVHPLHVESVAWVAERKDVLSTLFWILATWAYVWCVRRPAAGRYIVVACLLGLGLMAKPMLVSLPLILLLMDYWPLNRRVAWRRLLIEKVHLMAVVAVFSIIAYVAQKGGGALASVTDLSIGARIANALYSYIWYAVKMIWPTRLAVLYPHPGNTLPEWQVVASALVMIALSVAVLRARKKSPYLALGWSWYVVTLLPVIGLVQFGMHGRADRFTYVPLIGLFVAVAWALPELAARVRLASLRPVLAGGAVIVILASAVAARIQTTYWSDTETLFERAIAVTKDNYVAHCNLADALETEGNVDGAIKHYTMATKINAIFVPAQENLARLLLTRGMMEEAVDRYSIVVRLDPKNKHARYNLGLGLQKLGRIDAAAREFKQAGGLDPNNVDALLSLANTLAVQGKVDEAIQTYRKVLRIDPLEETANLNLGATLLNKGALDEALAHATQAARLLPKSPKIRNNLGAVLAAIGRTDEAAVEYRAAIRLDPRNADAYSNMAVLVASQGELDESLALLRKASSLAPRDSSIHANLAITLYFKGDYAAAWREVHLCRKYGAEPNPAFVQELTTKMPDPGA